MNIIESISNLFTKKQPEEIKTVQILESLQPDLFTCHNCQHQFEVTDKMIFPTSVRLLYKDQFVIGKGVMCPKCKQNSIFG